MRRRPVISAREYSVNRNRAGILIVCANIAALSSCYPLLPLYAYASELSQHRFAHCIIHLSGRNYLRTILSHVANSVLEQARSAEYSELLINAGLNRSLNYLQGRAIDSGHQLP